MVLVEQIKLFVNDKYSSHFKIKMTKSVTIAVIVLMYIAAVAASCASKRSVNVGTWNLQPMSNPARYVLKRILPDDLDLLVVQGIWDTETQSILTADMKSTYPYIQSTSIQPVGAMSCSDELKRYVLDLESCFMDKGIISYGNETYDSCKEELELLYSYSTSCAKCIVTQWNYLGDISECLGGSTVPEYRNEGRLGVVILSRYEITGLKTNFLESVGNRRGVITFTMCNSFKIAAVAMNYTEPLELFESDPYTFLDAAVEQDPDIVLGDFGFGSNHRSYLMQYMKERDYYDAVIAVGRLSLYRGNYCPETSLPGCANETNKNLNHIFISKATRNFKFISSTDSYPVGFNNKIQVSSNVGLKCNIKTV